MMSKATGASQKQMGLMNQVVIQKPMQFKMTKSSALFALMMPAGISLEIVRGFCSSISLSMYLLNAIAALRAKTIQSKTSKNSFHGIVWCSSVIARKKPISAKGSAKMVWLNFMRER